MVERHQQKIFALVIYLIGGDKNKVYAIATGVFAETLRTAFPLDTDNVLLAKLVRSAIEKCRNVKAIPSFDDSDFAEARISHGPAKMRKKSVLIVDDEAGIRDMLKTFLRPKVIRHRRPRAARKPLSLQDPKNFL